jgi:hypothetical protein
MDSIVPLAFLLATLAGFFTAIGGVIAIFILTSANLRH